MLLLLSPTESEALVLERVLRYHVEVEVRSGVSKECEAGHEQVGSSSRVKEASMSLPAP